MNLAPLELVAELGGVVTPSTFFSTDERQHEPLCAVPTWWQPARCARLLRTGAELAAEGRALGHTPS